MSKYFQVAVQKVGEGIRRLNCGVQSLRNEKRNLG